MGRFKTTNQHKNGQNIDDSRQGTNTDRNSAQQGNKLGQIWHISKIQLRPDCKTQWLNTKRTEIDDANGKTTSDRFVNNEETTSDATNKQDSGKIGTLKRTRQEQVRGYNDLIPQPALKPTDTFLGQLVPRHVARLPKDLEGYSTVWITEPRTKRDDSTRFKAVERRLQLRWLLK